MFVVLYCIGGTDRCKWFEIFVKFPDKEGARKYIADNINFLGCKQVVLPYESYLRNGGPIGWNAEDASAGHVDSAGWWWRDAA